MPRAVTTELRLGSTNGNWRGGKTKHPLYEIYIEMIARCERPTHKRYADYGGRGITVDSRWRANFWTFVADMGPRPEGTTAKGKALWTLDRVDNNAGYGPHNCRWATWRQQNRNKRGYGDGESRREPETGRYGRRAS